MLCFFKKNLSNSKKTYSEAPLAVDLALSSSWKELNPFLDYIFSWKKQAIALLNKIKIWKSNLE